MRKLPTHTRRLLLKSLATAPYALAQSSKPRPKILLPSDKPDEFHFRIMWNNPIPPLDLDAWRLEIKGLVEKPQSLDLATVKAIPHEEQNSRMKCVQCWSSRATWSGFRFPHLLEMCKPLATAKAVRIDCADKWYEYFTIRDLSHPRVMFVTGMGGAPLTDQHGAPLRLIDPARYGYRSAKLVTSLTFVEKGEGSMACDVGPYYSPDGMVLKGYDTPLDLGGERRKISGGEITDY